MSVPWAGWWCTLRGYGGDADRNPASFMEFEGLPQRRVQHLRVDFRFHLPVDKELKAGHQGVYRLKAPNVDSMPGINGGFQVLAFAVRPDSVSVSPLDKPNRLRSNLEPSAINTTIPVGRAIVLKVSLRNRFGQPVPRSHVAISLGQVIYAQNAIVPAEAAINGHSEGETPVTQYTNRAGIAVFRVRDVQPQSEPIYFQAYISPSGRYPYGYSNILTVNFRKGSGPTQK